MKDAPEIAPEIRGLLEELVADPRSSIRLAPRRALGKWFDSDETVREREISGTKLERHLIAAHREELAQLLFEASRIAYWKAPSLTVPRLNPSGRPMDSAALESNWRPRAVKSVSIDAPGVGLLRHALTGPSSDDSLRFALGSLSLVPSERTRVAVAQSIPANRPRTAMLILARLTESCSQKELRVDVLTQHALRTCMVNGLGMARDCYHRALRIHPDCIVSWAGVLNLSCFLGEPSAASQAARALDGFAAGRSVRLSQVVTAVRPWIAQRESSERASASRILRAVADQGSESASMMTEAFVV